MNHSHSAIAINQSDGSNSMIASPLRQALLDIEEKHSCEIQRLFDRVRTGAYVWNAQFDRILPLCWRRFSIIHWTPVQVARRAAQFLVSGPETQVLDVESGAGKFCLVGALATQGDFTGVEQRPHLAELSRSFAHKYAIPEYSFCVPMPETWTGADTTLDRAGGQTPLWVSICASTPATAHDSED